MEQTKGQPPPIPINAEVAVIAPELEAVVDKGEEDDPSYDPSNFDDDIEAEEEVELQAVKRKRRTPEKTLTVKPLAKKKVNEYEKWHEDVCFICYDGGNLVCCDRRDCPKVYHAVCVNREEEFLTMGKWDCSWHICSKCEKAAQYLCCTCAYSLCRGCIKNLEFICVRGRKGFCQHCYSKVMLIESESHDSERNVDVNFNDKPSIEYLFREYWVDVQRKLSLEVEELQNAKAQLNGPFALSKSSSSDESYAINNDKESSSDSSSRCHRSSSLSKRKSRRRYHPTVSPSNDVPVQNIGSFDSQGDNSEWASKELLEFVAYMKGGDKSPLSQSDVQALLLEYIKQNNLRDPGKKSQIICDKMLENLTGKTRVEHFEMLQLLELHFPDKEASHVVADNNHGANVELGSGYDQTDKAYIDGATKVPDNSRKGWKKNAVRDPQANHDDYAAIDKHNISLIFLRRSLIEKLLDDMDTFTNNVVRSFVRIRAPCKGRKQEIYRLVQVVGTHMAAEKYRTGKKTTYFILEVQNLDKKISITINECSNQDFTEEECKRLRQSIKCGLLSRFTVGDVQEKAMALQVVRVNEGLENEKQRASHLRDLASERGRRKQHRECVERLQLLNTPEERTRRMNQIPEIHTDPKMDPEYESSEEEEKSPERNPVASVITRELSSRKGEYAFPPETPGSSKWVSNKITKENNILDDKTNQPPQNQQEAVTDPSAWNNDTPTVTTAPTPPPPPADAKEVEKIWNYRDPAGNIQGPFSVLQLRKWNTTGLFPVGMRIWRASETEVESILLSNALNGKFEKDFPQREPPPPTGVAQNFNTMSISPNPLPDANTISGQIQRWNQIQNITVPIALTYGNWSFNSPIPPPPIVPSNQWFGGTPPVGQSVPSRWRSMNMSPQPPPSPNMSPQPPPSPTTATMYPLRGSPVNASPPPSTTATMYPSWGSPVNAPPPPATTAAMYSSWGSPVNAPPPPATTENTWSMPSPSPGISPSSQREWGTWQERRSPTPNARDVNSLVRSSKGEDWDASRYGRDLSHDASSHHSSNFRRSSRYGDDSKRHSPANAPPPPATTATMYPSWGSPVNAPPPPATTENTWSMPSPSPGISPSSQREWGTWQERRTPTPNARDVNSSVRLSKGEDRGASRYGRNSSHDASRHRSSSFRRSSRYDDDSKRHSRYDDRSRHDSRHRCRHREDSRRDLRYGGHDREYQDRRDGRSRTPPREGKGRVKE